MKKYIKNNKIKSINERTLVAPRSLANQSGAALVTALLLMLVMVTMVPVAMQLTSGEFDRTADFEGSRKRLLLPKRVWNMPKSWSSTTLPMIFWTDRTTRTAPLPEATGPVPAVKPTTTAHSLEQTNRLSRQPP